MDELELLKQKAKDMRELKSLAKEIWQLNQKLSDLESNGLFDTESFLNLEIEKEELEAIIEEMAFYIAQLDNDEDICKRIEKPNCNNDTSVPVSECIKCIKEYFRKEAEK